MGRYRLVAASTEAISRTSYYCVTKPLWRTHAVRAAL